MKTIDDFNFNKKTVLLRIDVNASLKNGKPEMNEKFVRHAKTIKELLRKKAKVVILAHQSRPGREDFTSLKSHARLLSKLVKVKFVDDVFGNKAVEKIKSLKPGEALMLENVRSVKEEYQKFKNNKMVNVLAGLADIYVNDAFSVLHRAQASIVYFPKVLPACAGRVLIEELTALKKLKLDRNVLFILSGNKVEENLKIMQKYKANKFLLAGVFAQYCLMHKGVKFGAQEVFMKRVLKLKKKKINHLLGKNVQLPKDFGVKVNGNRKNCDVKEFPLPYEIFDIGPQTINNYLECISKAKSVFIKGTPGYSEDERFKQGTLKILKAVTKVKTSFVAGGHTTAALKRFRISPKRFTYVSLSGGALLTYILGNKLPGLEALKNV